MTDNIIEFPNKVFPLIKKGKEMGLEFSFCKEDDVFIYIPYGQFQDKKTFNALLVLRDEIYEFIKEKNLPWLFPKEYKIYKEAEVKAAQHRKTFWEELLEEVEDLELTEGG